jgi:hypothetical protein
MRLIVDVDTDAAGRPAGTVHVDGHPAAGFEDWLDLLRVLEAWIDASRTDRSQGAP